MQKYPGIAGGAKDAVESLWGQSEDERARAEQEKEAKRQQMIQMASVIASSIGMLAGGLGSIGLIGTAAAGAGGLLGGAGGLAGGLAGSLGAGSSGQAAGPPAQPGVTSTGGPFGTISRNPTGLFQMPASPPFKLRY